MKTRHLTEEEIKQMADWAVDNYELSCCWRKAFDSAIEFAADEFSVKATKSQAATAINIAKATWEGFRIKSEQMQFDGLKERPATIQEGLTFFDNLKKDIAMTKREEEEALYQFGAIGHPDHGHDPIHS